ncbi:hypothetical protein HMPREF3096_17420 [Klebsiella sp. HMSC25G12]|nr:hypothetical protein HMPREF3096_17420 [Klebsiella sp. HMSC25G12]
MLLGTMVKITHGPPQRVMLLIPQQMVLIFFVLVALVMILVPLNMVGLILNMVPMAFHTNLMINFQTLLMLIRLEVISYQKRCFPLMA